VGAVNTVTKRKQRRERAETVGANGGAVLASAATGKAPRVKYSVRDAPGTAANLFLAIGAVFGVVGLVDLGMLWTPARLGTAAWEFATISQTFTNLPVPTFGLLFVTLGLVLHPRRHPLWIRGAAAAFGIIALILVSMGLLFALSVPAVVGAASPEVIGALKRAILKNGTEIVAYPIAFGVLGMLLWRGVERVR
jgi:hypothetical protein